MEAALVRGLTASGMAVIRIGVGPTPMLYYTATTRGTDGAIMVTGSHNPPDYNGFKMMVGRKPFFGEQIKALGAMAAAGRSASAQASGSTTRQAPICMVSQDQALSMSSTSFMMTISWG